ncbi:MAG: hypothetical protein GYB67_12190 [Chloroflexi bacterium]|nr:hypothetical protein [Chloroflexota bacterium]
MMPSAQNWVRNFTVTDDDIEMLTGLLLERETPLRIDDLARALIDQRLQDEAAAFQERYRDVQTYNPSQTYAVDDRVVFPALNYATARVVAVREGHNPEYGVFSVISVVFDDTPEAEAGDADLTREFAAGLTYPHKLSQESDNGANGALSGTAQDPAALLKANRKQIIPPLEAALESASDLVRAARLWFPRDLLLEVNEGHLNLAEAVLDLAEGGPLTAEQIVQDIGGLGSGSDELQAFSMNLALNDDPRFDEVGPVDQVIWFLQRLEPPTVLTTPPILKYNPVNYDPDLLSLEMIDLEYDINDEWSPIDAEDEEVNEAMRITLTYPHRRAGTLPLNAELRQLFPTARRTPRVWVTLIDGQDGEAFNGWVVRQDRYVYGLENFYRKHLMPVGAYITVEPPTDEGNVVIKYDSYRPRTEWVRLITISNDQLVFEDQKRSIGAEYDDLMIVGIDDLAALDQFSAGLPPQRATLGALLKMILSELSRKSPQGTVHAKTLYSVVNVLRRYPPGPVFATLEAMPDFEHVGNHYWKLGAE